MAEANVLVEGLHFGECPRWRDGRLWFSDFYAPAVMTVDLDGRVERVVEVPGQPAGLGWLPEGTLLVASRQDRRLWRLEGSELVEHADLNEVAAFHLNDMLVTEAGRAYVGNFGFDLDGFLAGRGLEAAIGVTPSAVLARVDPDGGVHPAAPDLRFPNGIVLTPDGQTLIVAETLGSRLTAFDVDEEGGLSARRVWASLEGVAPDGLTLDAEGACWVANAVASECLRVAEGGETLDRVVTSQTCFAPVLGGPDGRTLFLCTAPDGDPDERSAARDARVETVTVAVPGAGRP